MVFNGVVPTVFRGLMLKHAHDAPTAGHRGEITYELLRDYAYWPHMLKDVQIYCQGCLVCAQFQPQRSHTSEKGVLISMVQHTDWLYRSCHKVIQRKQIHVNDCVFVYTCVFTKWLECLPVHNNTVETCAHLLINHVFFRFGLSLRIDSDQGQHFTSEIMSKMWKILGVKWKLHIAYCPASSGSVECYNQSIVNVLKKFVK